MMTNSRTKDLCEVWVCFKEGNEEALRQLMKQFYATMYNYGCKFSNDKAFIKDCIQDVFIGMWQYRATMAVPLNTKAYLLTAVRRKMYSNKPAAMMHSLEGEDFSSVIFSGDCSPEEMFIEEESLEAQATMVAGLLNRLSDRQREIIYLKFYQGLNRYEIARIMEISDQSVSNLFQKAIHSLRKIQPANITLVIQLLVLILA